MMKKAICIVLCLSVLVACKSTHKNKVADTITKSQPLKTKVKGSTVQNKITPFNLSGYTVIDTGVYDAGENQGSYAILQKDGKIVDTIDLNYGVRSIDRNRLAYFTIHYDKEIDKNGNCLQASLGNYTIVTGDQKEKIADHAIDFDDYFSSPAIINGQIYYWAIKKLDSNWTISVSAAKFNPMDRNTVHQFIYKDTLDTDDGGYFPLPYQKNDSIYFDANKKKHNVYPMSLKP